MSNILSKDFHWSKEPVILSAWRQNQELERILAERQEQEEAAIRAVRNFHAQATPAR